MRLAIFQSLQPLQKKTAHTHPSFPLQTVTSFHRLGLTRYYGTIRHLAAHRFGFPLRVIPPLPYPRLRQETTTLPSVICTFYSIHPDPNHVDESCRSYPFRAFLQAMLVAKVSPFSRRVTLHRRHLWFTAFRAGLCLQTLQILPRERHPVSPPPSEGRTSTSATAL